MKNILIYSIGILLGVAVDQWREPTDPNPNIGTSTLPKSLVPISRPSSAKFDWINRVKTDSAAVLQQLAEPIYISNRYDVVRALFEELASRDIQEAMNSIDALPGISAKNIAWGVIIDKVYQDSPEQAFEMAKELRFSSPGQATRILERWVQEAPDNVAKYMNSLNSAAERKRISDISMRIIASNDGVDSALKWHKDWTGEEPSVSMTYRLLTGNMLTEFGDVSARIQLMSSGFLRKEAASQLVHRWSINESKAVVEWIESIPDPMLKRELSRSASRVITDTELLRALEGSQTSNLGGGAR